MKKQVSFLIIIFLLISCDSKNSENKNLTKDSADVIEISIIEEPENNQKENGEKNFEFLSVIRPGEDDLTQGVRYVDELRFIDFNDDYDYGFSRFITEQGDTVNMLHNDVIDEINSGKLMKVLWEIGTYYEAGEGEQEYYKEHLISYEIIED